MHGQYTSELIFIFNNNCIMGLNLYSTFRFNSRIIIRIITHLKRIIKILSK
jgi:hypothetical protein